MTGHLRHAFALALLAGVSLFVVDTAEAKNSGQNTGQSARPTLRLNAFKVKPKLQRRLLNGPKVIAKAWPNVGNATPRLQRNHLAPKVTARARLNLGNVPPRLRLETRKLSRQLPPISNQAFVVAKPRTPKHPPKVTKLDRAKIGRVPLGQAVNGPVRSPRNRPPSASGVQDRVALPPVSKPPFNQDLVDAVTVTGGAPDWWKALEIWSDLANAGPGNFQPEFLPDGRGKRPEIDLNPFGPDRSSEAGERGVGPRGWPGSGQGDAPFSDPSGKVSNEWARLGGGSGPTENKNGVRYWDTWVDDQGNGHDHSATFYDNGSWMTTDTWRDVDGTVDSYVSWTNGEGVGKSVHYRNGEVVRDVILSDPVVISADEEIDGDEADEEETDSEKSEDGQPVAEGTGRPRGGARDVRCGWWGCLDGGVSTPVRTNPGHADDNGSVDLGGSTGTGAVTDPTPMDGPTKSGGGGYNDPAPGGNPGEPDGP